MLLYRHNEKMKLSLILIVVGIIALCSGDFTIYRGTICGWAELTTSSPILCNNIDPRHGCPSGYSRYMLLSGLSFCYKTNTTKSENSGIPGTLCGGLSRTSCGGFVPNKQCPPGYTQDPRYICYKTDPKIQDASGTVCGLISEGMGRTCNGLTKGTCPDGYYGIDYHTGDWHACFKK